MSVSIATGGMFRDCCGGGILAGGGGAPSVHELAEKNKFSVKVLKVYFEDLKKSKIFEVSIKNIFINDI